MKKALRFVFDSFSLDKKANQVRFAYTIELADGTEESCTETLAFPGLTPEAWDHIPSALLERLLQTLHLALGMSYWKMYCPPELVALGYPLHAKQAAFWQTVYTKGLGEFFYHNKIDFRDLIHFSADDSAAVSPIGFVRQDRSLVPIGGGKDSLVTAELLRRHKHPFIGITLGTSWVQERIIEKMEIDSIVIERKLDPVMIERSKSGEAYNGHIPISSIYYFVSVLAAALYDYRYIAFSNEWSANFGNVNYLGSEINHQWSKSLEFEQFAREYVHTFLTPDITPFSFPRPMHEIEIVRRFVEYPQYFSVFSSCNRNFVLSKQQPEQEGARWCGECPKCAFVFTLLSAFISKEKLVMRIFGRNLFANASLLPLFKSLLGVESFKPFECVGTPEEMKVALARAHEGKEYIGDPIMEWFHREVRPTLADIPAMESHVFTMQSISTLPEEFRPFFDEVYAHSRT